MIILFQLNLPTMMGDIALYDIYRCILDDDDDDKNLKTRVIRSLLDRF